VQDERAPTNASPVQQPSDETLASIEAGGGTEHLSPTSENMLQSSQDLEDDEGAAIDTSGEVKMSPQDTTGAHHDGHGMQEQALGDAGSAALKTEAAELAPSGGQHDEQPQAEEDEELCESPLAREESHGDVSKSSGASETSIVAAEPNNHAPTGTPAEKSEEANPSDSETTIGAPMEPPNMDMETEDDTEAPEDDAIATDKTIEPDTAIVSSSLDESDTAAPAEDSEAASQQRLETEAEIEPLNSDQPEAEEDASGLDAVTDEAGDDAGTSEPPHEPPAPEIDATPQQQLSGMFQFFLIACPFLFFANTSIIRPLRAAPIVRCRCLSLGGWKHVKAAENLPARSHWSATSSCQHTTTQPIFHHVGT
jgi:hypothetical protein